MNKTYNVTLNWSQLWEIRQLLEKELAMLTDSVSKAEDQRLPDCASIFNCRLDSLTDTLDALPEL